MPQINRVRIINFSYNNNARNIIDETFDFYQGENALLSLKNGGGKSVLVQLMLQPILPKTRLMGRKIEDFFKGKKSPSYIMIEWKLENQGGYLLTGISLANKETQVREQEDTGNSIKYFTFTSHYRKSNLFDIENIPLVKKIQEKIYIEEFAAARKIIASKDNDRDFTAVLYTEDDEDKKKYRRELESFNIFQDEWRSIILKINESEGGVIEIFEKCRTSQQLMNEWILKSIEKVVNNEDKDQRKLEQMLENLVEEMIQNEHFIYEKEVYQDFLRECEHYLSGLNTLIISLDQENDLESRLARLYYTLKHECNKMREDIIIQEGSITASDQELNKIDFEERSKEFYDAQDLVNALSDQLREMTLELEAIRNSRASVDQEALQQKAARDHKAVVSLASSIAGIKEEIGRIKGDGDNHGKIRDLEYSLKIAYEKVMVNLDEKTADFHTQQEGILGALEVGHEKTRKLEQENSSLQKQMGNAEAVVGAFERMEHKEKEALQFSYERNLLGEINEEYTDAYLIALEQKRTRLIQEKDQAAATIQALEELIIQTSGKIPALRLAEKEKTVEDAKLQDRMLAYQKHETAIGPVFEKYDLDIKRRFYHQENQAFLQNVLNDLHRTERELELTAATLRENITSLKNGTLHVSKEFGQWLTNHDIDFETGENYLRKQNEGIRSTLVEQNPVLPFAFILYHEDIVKLQSMEMGMHIHQMVPILSYGELNHTYDTQGNLVTFQNKLHFVCLYDSRMMDAENLETYILELDGELEETKARLVHYQGELQTVREDLQTLKQFHYDKNDLYDLENKKDILQRELEAHSDQIHSLETERENNQKQVGELQSQREATGRLIGEGEKQKQRFYEFLEDNRDYLQHKRLFQTCRNAIAQLEKEKEAIAAEQARLMDEKDTLLQRQVELKREIKEANGGLQRYKDAAEGTLIEDALENLEERLNALKSALTTSLDRLEKDLKKKQEEWKEKEDLLASYGLEEDQYIYIVYDLEKLRELREEIHRLKGHEKAADDVCRKVEGSLKEQSGKLESAEKEVKKLAEAPIELAQIKLNFSDRRMDARSIITLAHDRITALRKLISEYGIITNLIEGRIQVERHEVNAAYEFTKGVREENNELSKALKNLQEENRKYMGNINLQYYKIKANFEGKNKHIENIFLGLEPLLSGAENNKNKYYYLGERILLHNESLHKLIQACEQRLFNVEKNKNDMVQHSYLHAKQVYDEVQKIPENSSIRLDGKSRPIPMLRINMVTLGEAEEESGLRMKGYIEACVAMIKTDMKENKKTEEIRYKISKYMSSKELLNVLSDLGKMTIQAYKIDINVKNSQYKTWEQVMKENSGGERFVSFFAVLIALMSYTRCSMKFEDDYQRNTDTKVLIMDNPFGPISSEHLLKPLFRIAEKYNTQLICLTDLKQNSILNCFNLIYMIKIRQNVFGTNEYIQLEKQIKEEAVLVQDEQLEKAIFKAKNIEQLTLL